MAGLKESITKALGKSELFNKTADFFSDTQKKFKANQALEDAQVKLTALYLELGKTSYKRRPLSPGRTSTVIRAEIDAAIVEVETLQKVVDELNAPKVEPEVPTEEPGEEPAAETTEEPAAPAEPENKPEE